MALAHRFRALPAAVLALGLLAGSLSAAFTPATDARADHGLRSAAIPPAASAEADVPAPEPVSLILAPSDAVLRPTTADVEVTIRLRNPGPEKLPEGRVELRFGLDRVPKTGELPAELPAGSPRVAEVEFGNTEAGEEQVTTVTVPRARIPLAADAPFGVHVLEAEFFPKAADPESDESEEREESQEAQGPEPGGDVPQAKDPAAADLVRGTVPLVWRGTESAAPSVPLGVIVPLVFPSDVHTLPTRQQLSTLTPGWNALLTEARTHNATLAIDPRIIAGIRAYGAEAPQNAREFLDRLQSLRLPTFMLQFADADPAAQAALGFTQLLAPTSLDFVSRFGTFPVEPSAPEPAPDVAPDPEKPAPESSAADAAAQDDPTRTEQSPTETAPANDAAAAGPESAPAQQDPAPDAEDPAAEDPAASSPEAKAVTPTLTELLHWPEAPRVAWPAEGAVSQATLDLLETSGFPTVVLDSANVSSATAPRAVLGAHSALVTDGGLAAAATAFLGSESAVERSAGAAQLTAQLALAAQQGSSGIILGLDRGTVAASKEPAQVLELLDSLEWVTPTPIAALPEGTATLRAGDTLEERRELLRSSAGRESSVNALGAVLVHPEYLSGYQRTRLLELFATRFATSTIDFAEVAAAYRERDAELLTGVRAISTEHTQLVGTSTRVPVQLRNALPFDATVQVHVEPSSGGLSVSERSYRDVAVPAEGNQRVLVPVRSRVSSGESGLIVSVAAASGAPTVFTGTLPISIRSSVETIGLWVLGGLAALLLGFGIWRSFRRSRRESEAATADSAPVADQDASLSVSSRSEE